MTYRSALVALLLVLACCAARAALIIDADLRKAAAAGDEPEMERLIAAGASVNRADALLAAVDSQQRGALLLLLKHGADPNAWALGRSRLPAGAEGSPVYAAARSDDEALLKILIHHGANLDAGSRERGREGETPLLIAIRRGELVAAERLVKAGAHVNQQTGSGDIALLAAIWAGANAVPLVKLLVTHGADPDLRNAQGKSARDVAYAFGSPEIMDLIDAAKPKVAFERPGDFEHIVGVLAAKLRCDLALPGFEKSSARAYRAWRSPRKAVVARIEASQDFQSLKHEMEQATGGKAGNGSRTLPDEAPSPQVLQEVCEGRLLAEFKDPRQR